MKLWTLGTSHGHAEKGRSCTASLLQVGGSNYLIDCGGSFEAMMYDHGLSFGDLRAVFITHMHGDHVGSIGSVIKHFDVYRRQKHFDPERSVRLYLPEQEGIDGLKVWSRAMHLNPDDEHIGFSLIRPGLLYEDDRIRVTAIPTEHIENGRFPSFGFKIEAEGKSILFTGDLAGDFHDYPAILFEEDFDCVIAELTHFNASANLETICHTRTKHMIFHHVIARNLAAVRALPDGTFPFPVDIAGDGNCFSI